MLHYLIIKVEVARMSKSRWYMAAIGKSIKSLCRKGEKKVELDDSQKSRQEHLDRIERESIKIMKTAALCYETNRVINLIVVGIGIVLITNSVVYGLTHEKADAWTYLSGGLGIVSFVTLFFTKPQQYITNALGNLAQIQVIYKSYCLQLDAILDYHLRNESTDIDGVARVNEALQRITDKAVELIQHNVESETERHSQSVNENGKEKAAVILEKSITTERKGNSVKE
jgi:hypothetical protein